MQHQTSYSGEESLVVASQQGNPHAWQQIVHQHEDEVRRTAYLLAGDLRTADMLARRAFLSFFRKLFQTESDPDIRPELLRSLARSYLSDEIDPSSDGTDQDVFPASGAQHFQVDDERTRLRAELDRLERFDRLALILRDFNGQDGSWITRNLDSPPDDLHTRLDRAHGRVREMVGLPNEEPVYGVLTRSAFDVSRADMWPEIEEPLHHLYQRARRRGRLITFGIAGVAALVLIAGLIWLFGGELLAGDDGDLAAAPTPPNAMPQAVSTPAARTATTQPDPAATSVQLPHASVPDLQLITAYGDLFENSERSQLTYDPATNAATPLVESSGFPRISPDGKWMVFSRFTPIARDYPTAISVVDSENQKTAWETGTVPIHRIAVTSDRIYIMTRAAGPDSWSIRARDLVTGEPLPSEAGELEDPELNRLIVEGSARLFVTPDEKHLYVGADEPDHSAGQWSRVLVSYKLPGLEKDGVHSHTIQWRDGQFASDFDFRRARLTPDGKELYVVMRGAAQSMPLVQFLDVETGKIRSVTLPFARGASPSGPDQDGPPQRLYSITGNGGTDLYIVASVRGEVAIVDLLDRRIERVFPVDSGDYADVINVGQLGRGAFAAPVGALSPDGSRLYVANIWDGEGGRSGAQNQFSVWTIDTATWRIVDRWQVSGYVSAILLSSDGQDVSVRSTVMQNTIVAGNNLTTFNAATGEVERTHRGFPVPEWARGFWLASPASLYRQQYGWAPSVGDGIPDDGAVESTLPAIEIQTPEELVQPGAAAKIFVRFADPATGETVRRARQDVRFSPDASVTIRVSHVGDSGKSALLVPQTRQDGYYQGSAVLDEPGWWTAQIIVDNPDGSGWRTPPRRILQVAGETASSKVDPGMVCPVPMDDVSCKPAVGTD